MVNSSAAEEYSYSEKEIVTEDGLKKIVKKHETSAGATDIHQAITSIPHLECFFFFSSEFGSFTACLRTPFGLGFRFE